MPLIQFLLLACALVAIIYGFDRLRAKALPRGLIAVWLLFRVALGVVAVLPETTSVLAKVVGVGRGADLAVYLALLLLFSLVFRLLVKIESIERELTRLVRTLALKDLPPKE